MTVYDKILAELRTTNAILQNIADKLSPKPKTDEAAQVILDALDDYERPERQCAVCGATGYFVVGGKIYCGRHLDHSWDDEYRRPNM